MRPRHGDRRDPKRRDQQMGPYPRQDAHSTDRDPAGLAGCVRSCSPGFADRCAISTDSRCRSPRPYGASPLGWPASFVEALAAQRDRLSLRAYQTAAAISVADRIAWPTVRSARLLTTPAMRHRLKAPSDRWQLLGEVDVGQEEGRVGRRTVGRAAQAALRGAGSRARSSPAQRSIATPAAARSGRASRRGPRVRLEIGLGWHVIEPSCPDSRKCGRFRYLGRSWLHLMAPV